MFDTRSVVVGNRIPVQGRRVDAANGEQDIETKVGAGGIAAAMSQAQRPAGSPQPIFIGTESTRLGPSDRNILSAEELRKAVAEGKVKNPPPFSPYGVKANQRENDAFYSQVANTTNWFLMHFMNEGMEMFSQVIKPLSRTALADTEDFTRKYVDEVLQVVGEPATGNARIWFQDYHFMLAPRILREQVQDASIGYFHHIPFPPPYSNSEKTQGPFAKISQEIAKLYVEGLLGADHIGFHTQEYRENFFQWVEELGPVLSHPGSIDRKTNEVIFGDRRVSVDVNPISVNVEHIRQIARDPEVQARAKAIREEFSGKIILFGADRLDPTKATPERLVGFQRALEGAHSLDPKNSVFIQYSEPSREHLRSMRQHIQDTEETVSAIRHDLGPHQGAVQFHLRGLPFQEIVAHALAADMLLATPAVDGLNLMVKEYAIIARMARELFDREVSAVPITGRGAGAWIEHGQGASPVNDFPDVMWGDVVGVAGSRAGSVGNGIKFANAIQNDPRLAEQHEQKLDRAVERIEKHDLGAWMVKEEANIDRSAESNRNRLAKRRAALLVPELSIADDDRIIVAELGEKLRTADKSLAIFQADSLFCPRRVARHDFDIELLKKSLADFASQEGRHVLILSGWGREQLNRFFPESEFLGKNLVISAHRGAEVFSFKHGRNLFEMHPDATVQVEALEGIFNDSPEFGKRIPREAEMLVGKSSVGFYLGECRDREAEVAVRGVLQGLLDQDESYDQALQIFQTRDYVGLIPKASKTLSLEDGGFSVENPVSNTRTALEAVYKSIKGFSSAKIEIAHFITYGIPSLSSNAIEKTHELGGNTVQMGQYSSRLNAQDRITGISGALGILDIASRGDSKKPDLDSFLS